MWMLQDVWWSRIQWWEVFRLLEKFSNQEIKARVVRGRRMSMYIKGGRETRKVSDIGATGVVITYLVMK